MVLHVFIIFVIKNRKRRLINNASVGQKGAVFANANAFYQAHKAANPGKLARNESTVMAHNGAMKHRQPGVSEYKKN